MKKVSETKEFSVISPEEQLTNSLEVPLGVVNFADTKQMIFKCFVQLQVYYKRVPIIFKSLNDNELYKIKSLAGAEAHPKYLERLNTYYFLHSIYMVDNVNVLKNREAFLGEARQLLEYLPPRIYARVLNELFNLGRRVNNSIRLVERYTFEPDSRWLWTSIKNLSLNSTDVTGIEGTTNLGYNICQLLWTFYNRREDEKNDFEKLWTAAKLVAGAVNPKGIKKLNKSDENRKIEEKNRRESIIYGKEYQPKFKVQSREELVDELEKQMRGEQDTHDKMIEDYLKRAKYEKLKKKEEQQKAIEDYQKTIGGSGLLNYDPEQVQKTLQAARERKEFAIESLREQRRREIQTENEKETKKELNPHYMAQNLTEEDIKRFEHFGVNANSFQKIDPGQIKDFIEERNRAAQGVKDYSKELEEGKQTGPIDPSIYLKRFLRNR